MQGLQCGMQTDTNPVTFTGVATASVTVSRFCLASDEEDAEVFPTNYCLSSSYPWTVQLDVSLTTCVAEGSCSDSETCEIVTVIAAQEAVVEALSCAIERGADGEFDVEVDDLWETADAKVLISNYSSVVQEQAIT
mmetsp:Transcript_24669/g.51311  ORF Transcript_24669/g.51311 Transcript_24669/m.51311 type:complete len:136 (-) Transcript_24669:22-429(-)